MKLVSQVPAQSRPLGEVVSTAVVLEVNVIVWEETTLFCPSIAVAVTWKTSPRFNEIAVGEIFTWATPPTTAPCTMTLTELLMVEEAAAVRIGDPVGPAVHTVKAEFHAPAHSIPLGETVSRPVSLEVHVIGWPVIWLPLRS